jgi:hypothetical protein
MVHDQIDDDAHPYLVGMVHELHEIAERAVLRMHTVIVGDVVAVIAIGRGIERLQPDAGNAQSRQVVEPRPRLTKSPTPSPFPSTYFSMSRQ